jgi:hypothetical protein
VRNPARKLPYGLEALVLDHLRINGAPAGHVADFQHRADVDTLLSRDRAACDEGDQIAPTLPAESDFDAFAGVQALT